MSLAMVKNYWWVPMLVSLVISCLGYHNDQFLDSSIPRVVTPPEQIATVRTKWLNGKLQQTTFLDKQDRILEDFLYGRTNEKIWNEYAGDKKVSSTHYYHSDSSAPGFVDITKQQFKYGADGRVTSIVWQQSTMVYTGVEQSANSSVTTYRYVGKYDTIVSPHQTVYPSTLRDTDTWHRNEQGQVVQNFRLHIVKSYAGSRLDTVYYYSHRFAHDKLGRRTLAWYDLMYLGRFYSVNGPDTIRYFYNKQNRLLREIHRYTTGLRNKLEIDTTSLNKSERRNVRDSRQRFFDANRVYFNNNRTDTIEYWYEPFNRDKHLPLYVSQDIGY